MRDSLIRDDEHGLNHFDYGAIEVRCFEGGPVLTRAAEIIWWVFDGNPGVFATLVRSVQPIERFLADGADVKGFEAAAVALRVEVNASAGLVTIDVDCDAAAWPALRRERR